MVSWPGRPVDEASTDLLPPVKRLLCELGVLEDRGSDLTNSTAEERERWADKNVFLGRVDTPHSLQVITAGSLRFSQQAAKVVTYLGGVAGIAATVRSFWSGVSSLERAVYIGAAAVLIASAVFSVAIIVRSDVQARAMAQSAEYDARGRIAATFLQAAYPYPPSREPREATTYYIKSTENPDAWVQVKRFDWTPDGIIFTTANNRHVRAENICDIKSNVPA